MACWSSRASTRRQADWLGVQYMYRAGYDPQAFIQISRKLDALEKHKPERWPRVFATIRRRPTASPTPRRRCHHPARAARLHGHHQRVRTDVKARLGANREPRKLNDKGNSNGAHLRRTAAQQRPQLHSEPPPPTIAQPWPAATRGFHRRSLQERRTFAWVFPQ